MYGENVTTVFNQYKYLGIYLSTRLIFSHALNDMAKRAKKGVVGIFKLLWSLGERSPSIFFKLFDTQIQPMVTMVPKYGDLRQTTHRLKGSISLQSRDFLTLVLELQT